MSGHKMATVTISQEEYRRLYEAEKSQQYNLEASPEFLRGTFDAERTQTLSEVNEVLFKNYSSLTESMQGTISEVENEINQIVHQINQARYEESLVRDESDQERKKDLKEIENIISNQVRGLLAKSDRLETSLDDMLLSNLKRSNQLQQVIQEITTAGKQIYQYILTTYPSFLRDENYLAHFPWIEADIEENLNNGFYEACLSLAQDYLRRLSIYRCMLDVVYLEWVDLYQQVIDSCVNLNSLLFQYQTFQPLGIDGIILDQKEDTNYWSHGIYQSITNEFNLLTERINSQENPLNSQELQSIMTDILPEYTQKISDCVSSARFELVSSQLRYQLANKVLFALVQQGYKPVEGNYDQQDFRSSYNARAVSVEGDEIVISVNPGQQDICQNQIDLISLDAKQRTESELILRAKEIRNSIISPELTVTNFIEINDANLKNSVHDTSIQSKQQNNFGI